MIQFFKKMKRRNHDSWCVSLDEDYFAFVIFRETCWFQMTMSCVDETGKLVYGGEMVRKMSHIRVERHRKKDDFSGGKKSFEAGDFHRVQN